MRPGEPNNETGIALPILIFERIKGIKTFNPFLQMISGLTHHFQ